MMKSGRNVANVYTHTPSRITAVAFITPVKYDRAYDRETVMGPPGATAEIFQYVERLEINPQHLLGY